MIQRIIIAILATIVLAGFAMAGCENKAAPETDKSGVEGTPSEGDEKPSMKPAPKPAAPIAPPGTIDDRLLPQEPEEVPVNPALRAEQDDPGQESEQPAPE